MWTCKIKIDSRAVFAGEMCCRHGINAAGYPLSSIVKEDEILVYFIMFLFCSEEKRAAFFKEFKGSDRIVNAEMNGNCIIGQIREPIEAAAIYNYNIVHIEPIIFSSEGYEIWTVASWDKKELTDFCEVAEKICGTISMSIKDRPISNVSVLTMHPELTNSQKNAINLACENGYYDIPRKIQIEGLAEMMSVSYSTYQAHLRKAEKKLLPFFSSRSM